jgi:hypothetical protein
MKFVGTFIIDLHSGSHIISSRDTRLSNEIQVNGSFNREVVLVGYG